MKAVKQSWIVRITCTVEKDVITKPCTKEQAERNPFEFADEELEVDMSDWEVKTVKGNL